MNRRTFVLSASAATLAAKPFPKPLGVQIYTARTILPKDPEGTLKRIADIGYKEVELFAYPQLKELVPIVNKLGMKATSMHLPMPLVTGNWGDQTPIDLPQFLSDAKAAGLSYVGMPYVAPNERKEFSALAAKMNKTGEAVSKAGMTFFYHNHAFEFAGKPGERVIDKFKKELDPKLVKLEMDIFWVAAGGSDPVAFLEEWRGRVALMHVKDKSRDMGTVETESQAKPADFKEVGTGTLDIPKILKTALKTGVDKFFVEQDQCPGDPIDSLKLSFENLKKMSF